MDSQKIKNQNPIYTILQLHLKKLEHEQHIHQVKQNHLSKKKKKKKNQNRAHQRQQPMATGMGFSHIKTSSPWPKRLSNAATATPRAVDGENRDSLAQIRDWRRRDRHKMIRISGNGEIGIR
ncbi:hypothetical protein ACJW30_10G060600 [Castanea mollissima]